MAYNVDLLADEFSVSPAELQAVFVTFFDETAIMLEKGEAALEVQDSNTLVQLAQDLFGSSANLRIASLAELAKALETSAKAGQFSNCAGILTRLSSQVALTQSEISSYYAENIKKA